MNHDGEKGCSYFYISRKCITLAEVLLTYGEHGMVTIMTGHVCLFNNELYLVCLINKPVFLQLIQNYKYICLLLDVLHRTNLCVMI